MWCVSHSNPLCFEVMPGSWSVCELTREDCGIAEGSDLAVSLFRKHATRFQFYTFPAISTRWWRCCKHPALFLSRFKIISTKKLHSMLMWRGFDSSQIFEANMEFHSGKDMDAVMVVHLMSGLKVNFYVSELYIKGTVSPTQLLRSMHSLLDYDRNFFLNWPLLRVYWSCF